jgi:hypothetical protein
LEDLDIDRIILKWIFKKQDGDVDWFALAQYRDRWRAVVKRQRTFKSHKMREIS